MSDDKLTDEQVREVLERIDPELATFHAYIYQHVDIKAQYRVDLEIKTLKELAETTVCAERAEEENKLMKGAVGIIKDCVPRMKGGPNDQ